MAYLYGLAITKGMPSMGRGKAAAHAGAHAANLFAYQHYIGPILNGAGSEGLLRLSEVAQDVIEWHQEGRGFGTTVILDAGSEEDLVRIVKEIKAAGHRTDLVVDPTYPYFTDVEILKLIDPAVHTVDPVILEDGRRVVCHRNQITAAYVFGDKEVLAPFLGDLPLLKND